jgi:hypothetical protein
MTVRAAWLVFSMWDSKAILMTNQLPRSAWVRVSGHGSFSNYRLMRRNIARGVQPIDALLKTPGDAAVAAKL